MNKGKAKTLQSLAIAAAALILPFSLGASAALDSGEFGIRASYLNEPNIKSSVVGLNSAGNSNETEPPEEILPAGTFAFTVDTAASSCRNQGRILFDGIGSDALIISPSGVKTPLQKINDIKESGPWVVRGTFTKLGPADSGAAFDQAGRSKCITEITEWKDTQTTDASFGFYGASNLKSVAEIPATITNADHLLEDSGVDRGLEGWDVSHVVSMDSMLKGLARGRDVNLDLNGWDVSNVVDMDSLFSSTYGTIKIDSWDVSKVQTMEGTFSRSTIANQDLSGWDISSVKSMAYMFDSSRYFGNSSSWDVSGLENVSGMFDTDSSGISGVQFPDLSQWKLCKISSMPEDFNRDWSYDPKPYYVNNPSKAPQWGVCS